MGYSLLKFEVLGNFKKLRNKFLESTCKTVAFSRNLDFSGKRALILRLLFSEWHWRAILSDEVIGDDLARYISCFFHWQWKSPQENPKITESIESLLSIFWRIVFRIGKNLDSRISFTGSLNTPSDECFKIILLCGFSYLLSNKLPNPFGCFQK